MLKNYDDVNVVWDELVDMEMFTWDELRLLTSINGLCIETLNEAIYARYGYRDLQQMMDE